MHLVAALALALATGPVIARARAEVARRVRYDPAYVRLVYPGGDVDATRGVCADLVVRALRAGDVDLQRLVHEDVVAHPERYRPSVGRADANIDHRRVPVLRAWLEAHATRLSPTDALRAGDVLVWRLGARAGHIGLVSDRDGPRGLPLVLHNLGPTPTEDDSVDAWPILGRYRLR